MKQGLSNPVIRLSQRQVTFFESACLTKETPRRFLVNVHKKRSTRKRRQLQVRKTRRSQATSGGGSTKKQMTPKEAACLCLDARAKERSHVQATRVTCLQDQRLLAKTTQRFDMKPCNSQKKQPARL